MPRAYRDALELATEEVDGRVPGQVEGTVIVHGVVSPGHPEPVPVVLIPGFEYRARRVWADGQGTNDAPSDGSWTWLIERRRIVS